MSVASANRWKLKNVRNGLRTDGKPRAPRKPCGCQHGCCLKCSRRDNRLYWSAQEVAAMRADYESGMSAAAVERKHGVAKKGLADIFLRRGYSMRPLKYAPPPRDAHGRIKPLTPATPAQIREYISRLKYVTVPPELKQQWKTSPMAWRIKLVAQIRARLKSAKERPTTPFSANVTPWSYGTPAAMAMAAQLNRGRNSQTKLVSIRAGSCGVIWDGSLWFWTARASDGSATGYLSWGKSNRNACGKKLLHHEIWERTNRRPVPAKHTVIFKDGNKNNFKPANLTLRSMADCARMNSIPGRLKKDPRNPVLLAKAKAHIEKILATRSQTRTHKARTQTGVLLQNFNTGGNSLAAKLRMAA